MVTIKSLGTKSWETGPISPSIEGLPIRLSRRTPNFHLVQRFIAAHFQPLRLQEACMDGTSQSRDSHPLEDQKEGESGSVEVQIDVAKRVTPPMRFPLPPRPKQRVPETKRSKSNSSNPPTNTSFNQNHPSPTFDPSRGPLVRPSDRATDWWCPVWECRYHNYGSRQFCHRCKSPRNHAPSLGEAGLFHPSMKRPDLPIVYPMPAVPAMYPDYQVDYSHVPYYYPHRPVYLSFDGAWQSTSVSGIPVSSIPPASDINVSNPPATETPSVEDSRPAHEASIDAKSDEDG
jgi:hypothetical protein